MVLNKKAQMIELTGSKFISFALIIAGGAIVSFVPDNNLKVLGGLLVSIGVALGTLK